MLYKRLLTICLCASGLSACGPKNTVYYSPTYSGYQPYYQDTQYSQPYNGNASYGEYSQPAEEGSVSSSYYAGPNYSPKSHKELDRSWVSSQNPNGYTIEVGESEKAAQVAAKLYNAPKNDRMAEIKAYRDGKTYYKGVYGSYNNYDEAQKALNNLPSDLKQGANIKTWSSVQENTQ